MITVMRSNNLEMKVSAFSPSPQCRNVLSRESASEFPPTVQVASVVRSICSTAFPRRRATRVRCEMGPHRAAHRIRAVGFRARPTEESANHVDRMAANRSKRVPARELRGGGVRQTRIYGAAATSRMWLGHTFKKSKLLTQWLGSDRHEDAQTVLSSWLSTKPEGAPYARSAEL